MVSLTTPPVISAETLIATQIGNKEAFLVRIEGLNGTNEDALFAPVLGVLERLRFVDG